MAYFIAGLPIIIVIVLLVLRTPPIFAVLISIAVIVASIGVFPIHAETALASVASMGAITLTVVVIMFAGIALTKLQQLAGAQQSLSGWLNQIASSQDRAVLIFGIALVPLIESLIGWGMGVIVVLPLLAGAGLSKLKAIQVSLLGLMLCPWGSFSPALLLLTEVTGLSLTDLGTSTAWFNVIVIAVLCIAIVLVSGGLGQLGRMWFEVLATWAVMSAVLVIVNLFVTPSLAGVLAALAALLVLMGFARGDRKEAEAAQVLPPLARRGLVPYAIVLAGLGAATMTAPLLSSGPVASLLTNPAVWLVLALACTPAIVGLPWQVAARGLAVSLRAFVPSVTVTLLFIGFGMLIGMNGMGAQLAEGATSLGGAFVLLVPLSGFISGFVTSSNTAAAAMLSEPLQSAAVGLGVDPLTVLGMHTAATGASVMASPSRAVLAMEAAKLLPGGPDRSRGPVVTIGRVLAPVLWANLAIVVLLTVTAALIG